MKYVNANLGSYKEFIQRMLNGEVFYHPIDTDIRYLYCEDGFYIDKHGKKSIFDPFKVGYRNVCIKIEDRIEDAIAVKPRMCWVSDFDDFKVKNLAVVKLITAGLFVDSNQFTWLRAKLVELNEIKQYLGDDNE